jgi:hypothetical protein
LVKHSSVFIGHIINKSQSFIFRIQARPNLGPAAHAAPAARPARAQVMTVRLLLHPAS